MNSNTTMRRAPAITNSGGRTFTPAFTAAVMVKELIIRNPGRSTPGSDYAVGYLMNSVPGLEAKFDEQGRPLTRVVAMLKPPEQKRAPVPGRVNKAPPDLAVISIGNGNNIKPFSMWQILIFEGARISPGNPGGLALPTFTGKFLSIGPTSWERGKTPWPAWAGPKSGSLDVTKEIFFRPAMVMPKVEQGGRSAQKIAMAYPERAVSVTSDEQLRSLVAKSIDDTYAGYPGFLLISRQILPPGRHSEDQEIEFARDPNTRTASLSLLTKVPVDENGARIMPGNNTPPAGYEHRTIDEIVAGIRPDHSARALWQQGWQHSYVPLVGLPQSQFTFDKGFDPAGHYCFNNEWYGFSESIITATQSNTPGGGWVSPFQKPINSCGAIISPEDLITPDMPESHRVAAQELTSANTASRLAYAAQQAAAKNTRGTGPQTAPQGGNRNDGGWQNEPQYGYGPPAAPQPQPRRNNNGGRGGPDYEGGNSGGAPAAPAGNFGAPLPDWRNETPPANNQGHYPDPARNSRPSQQGYDNHSNEPAHFESAPPPDFDF